MATKSSSGAKARPKAVVTQVAAPTQDTAAATAPAVPAADPATADPAPQQTLEEIRAELRASLEEEIRAEIAAELKVSDEQTVPVTADPPAPADTDSLVVSFVEDGFTLLGQVWYTGQELEVALGSADWQASLLNGSDPSSRSVLELSEQEQIQRWGRRMFRPGRWAGSAYEIPTEASAEEVVRLRSIQEERDSREME